MYERFPCSHLHDQYTQGKNNNSRETRTLLNVPLLDDTLLSDDKTDDKSRWQVPAISKYPVTCFFQKDTETPYLCEYWLRCNFLSSNMCFVMVFWASCTGVNDLLWRTASYAPLLRILPDIVSKTGSSHFISGTQQTYLFTFNLFEVMFRWGQLKALQWLWLIIPLYMLK